MSANRRGEQSETHALDQSLGYLISRAATDMRVALDRALLPHGVSAPQWVILARIARAPGTTPAELADILLVSRPAVTGLLDRLTQAGMVRRERSERDGRSFTLSITPKARKLIAGVPPIVDELNQRFARGISEAERATLKSLIARIIRNVAELEKVAPTPLTPNR